jgi:hypothetical protein
MTPVSIVNWGTKMALLEVRGKCTPNTIHWTYDTWALAAGAGVEGQHSPALTRQARSAYPPARRYRPSP